MPRIIDQFGRKKKRKDVVCKFLLDFIQKYLLSAYLGDKLIYSRKREIFSYLFSEKRQNVNQIQKYPF